MPGNQAAYQESLRKAHNYAWDRKWPQAVAEYRRALAEFNTDPLVWTSLGAALLEAKRFVDAKEAYRQAADLTPEDVAVQQRLAEIYERLGDTENASLAQLQIATVLQRGPDPAQAVEAWRAILRMLPSHMDARLKLADLLEQLDRPVESAKENVALARILRDFGRGGDSAERARKALALDPRNAEARALSGDASVAGAGGEPDADALQAAVAASAESGGPVFEATQRALARLADSVFEASTRSGGTKDGVGQLLAQATDLHVRGRTDDAITAYRRALRAGHDTPDIHFALGILCLQTLRVEDAIAEFKLTGATPGYDLASAFALAQCSRACHDEPGALGHVLAAYKLMDEEIVPPAQIRVVEHAYESLAREHSGTANPAAVTDVLTQYLTGADWHARAADLRRQLDGASAPDEWIGLAEVVSTRNAPRLIEALRASRDYQIQDKPTAAGEECFHALSAAPYFLPLHARLAEIFVQQRRIDDAIAKYMAMAAVQRARGDMAKVTNTLGRVLTYAPDNIEVRESLIELLVSRGEIAEAIDQYLALGAVHMRLAQLDRAQKAYESALWLVPKSGVKDRWTLTTLHMLGEIFVQRAAWKEALPVYLQIRKLAPDDDKASLRLIDLYFKLGRQPETENELAHLIRLYERRGDETKLIPMIGDMVAVRPRNSVLRNHLVDLLLRAGDKERAIGELDALGELQLSGRQTRDAIQTIERIIALEPPNLDSYRTLLAQLQSDA